MKLLGFKYMIMQDKITLDTQHEGFDWQSIQVTHKLILLCEGLGLHVSNP